MPKLPFSTEKVLYKTAIAEQGQGPLNHGFV
jgi:hypothetical protein